MLWGCSSWDRLGAERETGLGEVVGAPNFRIIPAKTFRITEHTWALHLDLQIYEQNMWFFFPNKAYNLRVAFYLTIIKTPPLVLRDPIAISWSGLGLVLPQFIRNVVLSLNCIAWQFILASSPMEWSLSPCVYQWMQGNSMKSSWLNLHCSTYKLGSAQKIF